jgi:hypothetical protein
MLAKKKKRENLREKPNKRLARLTAPPRSLPPHIPQDNVAVFGHHTMPSWIS